MSILDRIYNWWTICRHLGHTYVFEAMSLGGEWIRCVDCHKLEEYIPGVHEPKGYK